MDSFEYANNKSSGSSNQLSPRTDWVNDPYRSKLVLPLARTSAAKSFAPSSALLAELGRVKAELNAISDKKHHQQARTRNYN